MLLFEAEMENISSTEHAHCFEVEGKLLTTFEVFSVNMIASQRPTCQKKRKKKSKKSSGLGVSHVYLSFYSLVS